MSTAAGVLVGGGFDDIRSPDIRFLEEASRLGCLTVNLWHDRAPSWCTPPTFSYAERAYILNAIRFVRQIVGVDQSGIPAVPGGIWAEREADASVARERAARNQGMEYRVIANGQLRGFPERAPGPSGADRKVAVTGCYDWLHSGHVRFFEEAAAFGDITVFLGSDTTIAELKGAGHPQFGQDERRYVVGAVRHVHHAQVSSGKGWLDADAEIRALKPDIFIVNEDGDRQCKRDYCHELGIEYRVLKRTPAEGLPVRSSTVLRGF